MANKEYIEKLQSVIRRVHGVDSKHIDTVHVAENLPGKGMWEGSVEMFELFKHPETQWCYAWVSKDDAEERITTVLQVLPVISPSSAVRGSILAAAKKSAT